MREKISPGNQKKEKHAAVGRKTCNNYLEMFSSKNGQRTTWHQNAGYIKAQMVRIYSKAWQILRK